MQNVRIFVVDTTPHLFLFSKLNVRNVEETTKMLCVIIIQRCQY
jgi:RsiW-degrading membrane proteinase PrsW (M82 family)